MKTYRLLQAKPVALFVTFLFALMGVCPVAVHAQNATGIIRGRVLNEGTGDYLRNAVITVAGTNVSTTSETGGMYTLVGVPAGTARVTVSFAGLDPVETSVVVSAGQTATQDFNLTSKADGVVKLGQFVVSSAKEGNAKAFMEQKESVNMKTVIASDAFGNVSEGNVGEFLKNLPGVTMDYNEADIRYARVRGLDPKYTVVTMDGAAVATGSSSDMSQDRAFDFEQLSIASIETVDLSKTPRPSDSASAVAGVINLRSKGAFDRKGRRINFQTSLSANSLDMTTAKTPGWTDGKTYKLMPNVTFGYSDVLMKSRLGVLLGFNYSYTFSEQKAATVNFANRDTDPTNNATEIPRISGFSYRDSPKPTTRKNFNARVDYKLNSDGTLWTSAKVDYNTYNGKFFARDLSFNFGTTDTTTQPYSLSTQTTTTNGGSVQPNGGGGASDKHGTTLTLTSTLGYRRGALTADFIGQYSKATNYYTDIDEGFFFTMGTNALPATLRFERNGPYDPGVRITQLGGADWRNLANYTLATAGVTKRFTKDQKSTLKGDFTYAFANMSLPTKLFFGASVNQSLRKLNRYANGLAYAYNGPDGVRATADDNPALFAEPYYRMNFGWGGNVDGMVNVDRFALGKSLRDHPEHWTAPNMNTGMLQPTLQNAYYFKEQYNAAYLEPVVRMGKLIFAPGLRYEFTRQWGTGPNDMGDREARRRLTGSPTGTVDTAGSAYIITRYGSGRRQGGSTYGDLLKYLHLTYNINPDLKFRASFHESITRPSATNLIPGVSGVNETAIPPTVTVSNPDLRPERARSVNLELEYYFSQAGRIGVTWFRTDVKDLQRRTPEELGPDGLDGDILYAGYIANTVKNVAKAHNSGLEFDYSQSLTFLPDFLRGITVGGNYTLLMPDDFVNYLNSTLHQANGNVGFRRGRIDLTVKANWTGVVKNSIAPGSGNNAGWGNYTDDRFKVDLDVNYKVGNRGFVVFLTGRNIFNEPTTTYTTGGGAPKVATRFFNSGSLFQVGLKGTF